MKKSLSILLYTALACASISFVGCQREQLIEPEGKSDAQEEVTDVRVDYLPGKAFVKVSEEGLRSLPSITSALRSSLRAEEDAIKLEPIFEIGGPYEALQREHNLHRWMKVTFPEDLSVADVLNQLRKDTNIETAEGALPVVPSATTYTPLRAPQNTVGYNNGYSFNDPLLPYQWHYQNDGSDTDQTFKAGADVNLFKAWDVERGKKNIIVGIIDSGVWAEHPDLKESMWSDPQNPGAYGYNFYNDNSNVKEGYHGTHVAGTIAARNNNQIGVSGVAGGDGTPDSGVRIMSLQIFRHDDPNKNHGEPHNTSWDNIARAFKWAAEHGATLLNCSWGTPYRSNVAYDSKIPEVLQNAMDYFVASAGVDPATGKQAKDAPMKGGVIIFAAGNDGTMDINIAPGYYEKVIAVGSFTPNYTVAGYSDSGDWVDIMAPGGILNRDDNKDGILSTISPLFKDLDISGNGSQYGREFLFPNQPQYAYAQGTSMAAPHVTGIAALILSKFGKEGYTADMLKERLLTALRDVDHYSYNDPKYVGKIGAGYIDAAVALEENKELAPKDVETLKVAPDYFSAEVTWGIATDDDSATGYATSYRLYTSDKPLTTTNGLEPYATLRAYNTAIQKEMKHTIKELQEGKKYYCGVEAIDRWGHTSHLKVVEYTTPVNAVPMIENLPQEPIVLLDIAPYKKVVLQISDPDGHSWDYEAGALPKGVSLKRVENTIEVTLFNQEKVGSHPFDITLRDQFNKKATYTIPFEIVHYAGPQVVAEIGNLTLTEGGKGMEINIKDAFKLPEGMEVTHSVISSDSHVVEAKILDGKLMVTPKKKGMASVVVTVNDGHKSARLAFDVTVSPLGGSQVFALYPMPARSYVTILTSAAVKEVTVTIATLRGETVHKGTYPVKSSTATASLSTDKLAPGVYRMYIDTGNGKLEERTLVKN